MALIFSFETGMIGNEAASRSVIAARGAEFYLRAERDILNLFSDSPEDLRQALLALFDDLRLTTHDIYGLVPARPRQQFVRKDGTVYEGDAPPGQ